jgi:hypothetical protein
MTRPAPQVLTPDSPLWDDWIKFKSGDYCDDVEYERLAMSTFELQYGNWDTSQADKIAAELARKLADQENGVCRVCKMLH